ncbi:MAG: hypothetical protein P8Y99_02380 [Calditrichaceae bacterium]
MAIDYYFSEQMNKINEPVLRFYGWNPFCLSLGKHQDLNSVNLGKIISDGYDIVRRPTGGSAIFHSDELTYSTRKFIQILFFSTVPFYLTVLKIK